MIRKEKKTDDYAIMYIAHQVKTPRRQQDKAIKQAVAKYTFRPTSTAKPLDEETENFPLRAFSTELTVHWLPFKLGQLTATTTNIQNIVYVYKNTTIKPTTKQHSFNCLLNVDDVHCMHVTLIPLRPELRRQELKLPESGEWKK
uniref:Uncharacterized protein n=1 Tax=Glossina pallidipes TaxID=7398 RepID=A0A1A9Z0G2_GLOPL